MNRTKLAAGLTISAAMAALMAPATATAETLKIGILTTTSGPPAVLGEHARDGALLAAEQLGTVGGMETEVIVVDAEGKPDVAAQKARELVERDGVQFVIGPIFSNVMGAIAAPVTEKAFLISPNAGPSVYAGEGCLPNLFVAAYQNDQMPTVIAKHMNDEGIGDAFILAPNYQAGKDSLNGFKSVFKGAVTTELYVPLGQLDYSAELAQIAAMQPSAIYAFLPGGMGVNFVKQYDQAGLKSIPLMTAFTVDETTLPAEQDAALGMLSGTNWSPSLDIPASKDFVAAFEAKFGYVPALYAASAYDAVMLIDSAVKKVGNVTDMDALRTALEAADFTSVRGDFSFSSNHFPVQNFYLAEAVKREDGKYQTQVVETVWEDYADAYVDQCKM